MTRNLRAVSSRRRACWCAALALLGLAARGRSAEPSLTQRHHQAGGGTLRSIAIGGGRIVTVGDRGVILSSWEGRTWTRQESHGPENLTSVVHAINTAARDLFVAVGESGKILASKDGDTWREITVPGLEVRLNHVSVSSGRLFVAGESGTILSSIDGEAWTFLRSGTSAAMRAIVAPGPSQLLAIGEHGTALVGRWDGEDWQPLALGIDAELHTMVSWYGAPVPLQSPLVETTSVGADGAFVIGTIHGATGRQFARQATPARARLRGLAVGAARLVTVGDDGVLWSKSTVDVATGEWTIHDARTTADLTAAAFRRTNESSSFFIVGEDLLVLQLEERHHAWLHNLALRAESADGSRTLTSGFVVGGETAKSVLLRAAGPALSAFEIEQPLRSPKLTLFDHAGREIASNSGWMSSAEPAAIRSAAQRVGAFAFPEASSDSALLLDLAPGPYTAQIGDRDGSRGIALIELYDLDAAPEPTSRFINLSARCHVGAGSAIAIPGVQSRGNRSPRLLIRAVGPGLARFGISDHLPNPVIDVIRPGYSTGSIFFSARTVVRNDNWNDPAIVPGTSPSATTAPGSPDDIWAIAARAGAFPLEEGSRDAALLVTLDPTGLSIQVSGADGGSGVALIEVYDVSDL